MHRVDQTGSDHAATADRHVAGPTGSKGGPFRGTRGDSRQARFKNRSGSFQRRHCSVRSQCRLGNESMTLLLDTHVWLWAVEAPEKLGRRTKALLLKAGNDRLVSAISALEIA